MSAELKYLRPSLIPNLLKNIQRNQRNFENIRVFEIGNIFKKPKKERRSLSGLITGDEFYQLKGVVDMLFRKLGISNVWYDDFQASPSGGRTSLWHIKKSAEIKSDDEGVGFLGEISSNVLERFKISRRAVAFDLDFEKLQRLCSEETIYQPVSRYPSAVRDLAVLVPRGVKVIEVLNVINAVGGKLIRDIDIFDIYEGKELPEDKKNLAFRIIYQSVACLEKLRTVRMNNFGRWSLRPCGIFRTPSLYCIWLPGNKKCAWNCPESSNCLNVTLSFFAFMGGMLFGLFLRKSTRS